MRARRHFLAAGAGLAAAAAGLRPAAADPAWDRLVAEAKGQDLNLIMDPYDGQQEVVKTFGQKFPGIRVQVTILHPSDAGPKIVTEQKNGLYTWDAWWSTASTMHNVVLPAGGLDKITDYMVLPEVADMANWVTPAAYRYTAENQPYVFIHTHFLVSYAHYNARETKGPLTFDRLLDPGLRGNIQIRPPNRTHGGTFMLAQIAKVRGLAYVQWLLTEMQPTFVDNDGQVSNAVIRGDTAVGIGTAADKMYECTKAGACNDVHSLPTQCMHSRGVSVPKNPPHKAAAKVFVTWLLSREGQETYVKDWAVDNSEAAFSLRRDVKPDPRHIPSIPDFKQLDKYVAVALERSKPEVRAIIDLYNRVHA